MNRRRTSIFVLVVGAAAYFAFEAARAHRELTRATRLAAELAAEKDAERERLEAALAAAQARPMAVIKPATGATSGQPTTETSSMDPDILLAELTRLRIRSGPHRIEDLHEVIYRLRALAHGRDRSVPAIAAYLGKFEDVEYPAGGEQEPSAAGEATLDSSFAPAISQASAAEAAVTLTAAKPATETAVAAATNRVVRVPGAAASASTGRAQFEFLTPPSLRLGLIEVLASIATPAAEAVLAEALQKTGRGIEIAILARRLQVFAPDRYRAVALGAARELLPQPTTETTSALDRQQKPYLYSVFDFYKDHSLTNMIPQLLVDTSGQLDRQAFARMSRIVGVTNAMPWIYQAFNQLSPTNISDRSRLLQSALPAAGVDTYASTMVRDVLRDGQVPAEIRGQVMQALAQVAQLRIKEPLADGSEVRSRVDPAAVQARLQFIEQLRGEFTDPALDKLFTKATRQLNRQLEPPTPPRPQGRPPEP